MSSPKKSVLFICLGNICRSPIAEAVFLDLLKKQNKTDQWLVDSAAIGTWHIGKGPDKRTLKTLKKFGLTDYNHTVRQICKEDFTKFDVIFGMDDDNMSALNKQKPANSTASLEMLGDYDPENVRIIEDPYFGDNIADFETVYEQCVRCCGAFLKKSS